MLCDRKICTGENYSLDMENFRELLAIETSKSLTSKGRRDPSVTDLAGGSPNL